jgi:arabinosaccharide transport system substrate-binding protein
MITFEIADSWCYYIMIQQQGSDYFDADGNCILDNDINIKTLQFMKDMIYVDKTAITTPGGGFHTEEYYGFMSKGGAASMVLPFWYMGRFIEFMPELKNKIKIAPVPAWTEGGNRSAAFGGTSTSITVQCKNQDLAKRFLYEAKISEEGAKQIWNVLGFDPLRTAIWSSDAMKQPNQYTNYFGPDIFDVVLQVKDEFAPSNITADGFSQANDLVAKDILFKALSDPNSSPAEILKNAANEIRKGK